MPGIGSQETHPIATLQDIGEFGVMGEFRFQAGIALFLQIIVVNGDKRVQVPVLRTYNPFAVQKGELVHILPLVLHLQKGEDMGVVIGEGRVCTQGVSCQFSFYIGIFYTYPCFYLPGFSERCIQRYISGVDILIVDEVIVQ